MEPLVSKTWAAAAILLALLVSVSAGQTPTPYQEAVALVQRQQFKPGITLLEKILDQSPNDLKAHNLMGIALTASGKVEEANAHFQKAISLNPPAGLDHPRSELFVHGKQAMVVRLVRSSSF